MRYLPLAVLCLFALVDVAANWHVLGMESVSAQVWRQDWGVKAALVFWWVVLGGHLFVQWPYGPAS